MPADPAAEMLQAAPKQRAAEPVNTAASKRTFAARAVSIVKLSFPGTRRTLTYLFALCGTALFIHLVRSVGAAKILRSIQQIGWGMLAIVAVGGCTFMVRSLAWRCTLGREYRRLPARTLFRVYVAGEAMGLLFFGGLAVGDTTRVLMLRGAVPTIRVISSVILDRGLYIVGSAIFLAATILLLPLAPHGGTAIPRIIYVIGSIYAAIVALVWIVMRRRMRLLSGLFSLLSKLRPLRAWTQRQCGGAVQIENSMFHFLNTDRPGLWSAFALNLAAHSLSAFEVLLVLWFLGASRSPLSALLIEGLTKIANLGGAVIPGNVGTYEGANIVILKLLGFQAATGLVLALCRDVRRLVWAGAGLALFLASGIRRIPESPEVQRRREAVR